MKIISRGLSDTGRKRDHNEDSFLIDEELSLFVVADGMGGHAGGGTASRLAVETIATIMRESWAQEDSPLREDCPIQASRIPSLLRQAVQAACCNIYMASRENPHLAGMGTTTVVLLIHGQHAFFAHVGDSRIYLVRDDFVQQVTEDHSLVNEQLRAGMITAEEALKSRYKNIITRSVGFERSVEVDVMGLVCEPGDTFILCSDGMSNLVHEDDILELAAKGDLDAVTSALVALANERGGDDNITVVAARAL
ncbi:MAG: Stp1/IreP family PP2C-type Ser/Thr phosphatase [Myxococcales bacterium]|nr:Stp1/IreP family PP2C-type Ser/Thr phosphatase [Myxococcales bacterium]